MNKKLLVRLAAGLFLFSIVWTPLAQALQIGAESTLGRIQVNHFEPLGQSFVAEDSNVFIAFSLNVINPHVDYSNLIYSLYEGAGFLGSHLGSRTIAPQIYHDGWYDVDFSTITLTSGSIYTAGIEAVGDSAYWGIYYQDNIYDHGTAYIFSSPAATEDMSLRVQATEPIPEPCTILLLSTGLIGLALIKRKNKRYRAVKSIQLTNL